MSFKRLMVLAAAALLTVAANAAQVVIPAAGTGPGANNSQWKSDVVLHNTAPREISVTMSLHVGTAVAGTKTISLPAKHTVILRDVARETFGLTAGTGALVLDVADRNLKYLAVTSRTYNTGGGAEFGQDIPAVRVEDAAIPGQIAVLSNPSADARFNFGVYAVEQTTIRWEVLRADGTPAAAIEWTYDAGQHVQHNDFLFNGAPLLTDKRAGDSLYARILDGRAIVYGSSINATGDPTFVPPTLAREDVLLSFGVDLNEDGKVDITDADQDGVLDGPVTVHTSLFPAYFRIVVASEFGMPVTLEVVESEAEATFRDANGTMRVGAGGDLKNKTGSIVVRATSDGSVALLTIPVQFK